MNIRLSRPLGIVFCLILSIFLAACSQETGKGEPGENSPQTDSNEQNAPKEQETAKEKVTIGAHFKIVARTFQNLEIWENMTVLGLNPKS